MDIYLNDDFIINICFPACKSLVSPFDITWLTFSVSKLVVSFHPWTDYMLLH